MPKTVLIVDDEAAIIELLQVNLEMEGYKVITARDGQAAVERASADMPDLILMDVMMPRMDGWSALQEILSTPKVAGIPVVMLSARAQQADIRQGAEAGAVAYVTKPFDPVDLLSIVDRILAGNYSPPSQN